LAQFFSIHPENPQSRLVRQAVDILQQGGLIAYPTDSAYALGCHIGDKFALDRIRAIRQGAYTFILNATSEVPRRLQHPKRKTLGMRVPDNAIALALLQEMGEPIMSSSLILPNDKVPLTDPYEIRDVLEHQLELVIDGGFCGLEPTTVVDLTDGDPIVLRQGCGDSSEF